MFQSLRQPLCSTAILCTLLVIAAGVVCVAIRIMSPSGTGPAVALGTPETADRLGMTVPSDAETGVPLPPIPREMAAEIRQLTNRDTEGLVEHVLPDGSVSIDTRGRYQSVIAGVRGPDGKIIIRHGDDFLQNVSPQ